MAPEYGVQPTPAEMPAMRGLFVGGCVKRGVGSSFRARAHAHCGADDEYRGWVCVRSPKRLRMTDGRPSRLLWHEYAHVITSHGHDDQWRKAMKGLGQPIPAQYRKRTRRKDETLHGCYRCGRAGGALVVLKHEDGHWYCWRDQP